MCFPTLTFVAGVLVGVYVTPFLNQFLQNWKYLYQLGVFDGNPLPNTAALLSAEDKEELVQQSLLVYKIIKDQVGRRVVIDLFIYLFISFFIFFYFLLFFLLPQTYLELFSPHPATPESLESRKRKRSDLSFQQAYVFIGWWME